MIKNTFFWFAVIFLFQVSPAKKILAQSLNKNNAVFVGVDAGMSPVQNSFTDEFTPSAALRFNLRFPFLSGQLEGGVRLLHFNGHAHTKTSSDFRSFYIYGGYYYPFRITDWYSVGPALYVGYNLIYYKQQKIYTSKNGVFHYMTSRVDGEYSYELSLRNQFQISEHWFIDASISYNHTYTRIPLPLTMVSVGVSYAFLEPSWLKTILK